MLSGRLTRSFAPALTSILPGLTSGLIFAQPIDGASISTFQNIYPISFGHNGLHCLPALNGATGSLGNFPECLTARSSFGAALALTTATHAFASCLRPPHMCDTRACSRSTTQQRGQWLKDIAAKLDPPRAIIARWQRYAGPDNGGARARQSSDSNDDGSELVLIRPGLSVRWAPHTRGCSSSR